MTMQRSIVTVINKTNIPMGIIHSQKLNGELFHLSHKKELIDSLHPDVLDYCAQVVPLHSDKVFVIDSKKYSGYNKIITNIIGVVDVNPVNTVSNINQHLFKINESICDASIFVGCAQVMDLDQKASHSASSNFLLTIQILTSYLSFQRRKINILSKAEILGRLVYAGFSIIEFKEMNGLLYYMVMKVSEPPKELSGSSNSLIFPMLRIGKDGKKLTVFKFRTMHPYSQYLQDYVVRLNGYNSAGKPDKDFRLTIWGKIFRKYWLDELPQFINLIKGELSIVGVRPLSDTRFSELPIEIQELRIQFKPGCIPPYVSLLMPDSKGNIEAERIYMNEKLKNGVRTDIKYFFLALKNIFTGKITSS